MQRVEGSGGTLLAAARRGLAARAGRRPRAMADLTDEVALVTGGSRGLGLLIARELVCAGCTVVICARDGDELERARAILQEEGSAAVLAVRCDVSDRGAVENMVEDVSRRFGRVDILVNNAGIITGGPISAMAVEDFQASMDTIFWGTLYPTLAVLPAMQGRGTGRIVTITSVGGRVSIPHLLPYSCAKFATVGLSEGLHAELARDGITVTTVVPGLMRTGSAYQATIKGQQEAEYTWFALLDSLPLISMDAERAAKQIVEAMRRGAAECVVSLPAAALARLHGLFPGATADMLGLANRLLPRGGGQEAAAGREVHQRIGSTLLDALMTLTRSAARRFNEPMPPAPPHDREPGF